MADAYSYFVGIDWGTEQHQACALDGQGRVRSNRQVAHTADGMDVLVDELLKLADGRAEQVAVGIETPRGALVEFLVERGFHVYSINPKQLDRFRDRHNVAGAKDDRLDAFVISDSLRTDLHLFRRVRVDDPLIIRLRELSRVSDDLKVELGRLSNQLRDQVHRLLPQLLALSPAADEPWLWDLLALVGSNPDPARIRPTQVERVLKNHRIRRLQPDDVLAQLRQKPPWTTPGTQQAVRSHIALLLPRLHVAAEQQRDCDKQIQLLLDELAVKPSSEGEIREHRDVQILQSLPGAGKVVVATMLAEASQPLADRDYHALRSHSGIAPVTRATGKRSKNKATVVMRYGCNGRLRDAFHYWAQGAVQNDQTTKAHYTALRSRGHSHGRALRSVADRLLRILFAMLNHCTLYDPARAKTRGCAVLA